MKSDLSTPQGRKEYSEFCKQRRDKKDIVHQGKYTGNWKVYVMELADGKYYVGISHSVSLRLQQHLNGSSQWTKLYHAIKPVYVKDTGTKMQPVAEKLEDDLTLEYAVKYGVDNVRGGSWSSPNSCAALQAAVSRFGN